MIAFEFDDALIQREMQRLEQVPWAVQKALLPAVTETMRLARESLAERLISDVPLPPRLLEQSIKALNLGISGQGVTRGLRVASKGVPLINYDINPMEVTARKGLRSKSWPGFTYALRKGDRREREGLIGNYTSGMPFIAQMRNSRESQDGAGHLGVYYRTSQGQIMETYGPHVQYHATTPQVETMLIRDAELNFARILPRIVDRVLAEHGVMGGDS